MLLDGHTIPPLPPHPPQVESRKTYDPIVVVVGRESRAKATMPIPRPIAMGILPTPNVNFEQASLMAWNAANVFPETATDVASLKGDSSSIVGSSKPVSLLTNGAAPQEADVAANVVGAEEPVINVKESIIRDGVGSAGSSSSFSSLDEAVDAAAAAGSGPAMWKDAPNRGCYEGVPGPKRRMRVYCFRSPHGELDDWVPAAAEPRIRKGFVRGARRCATGKKEGEGNKAKAGTAREKPRDYNADDAGNDDEVGECWCIDVLNPDIEGANTF